MYTCRFCGYRAERPVAYCPRCGAWKAFQKESEETVRPVPLVHIPLGAPLRGLDVGPLGGLLEMGLPRGAVVLLGGEPGVGKSTLLLQIASSLAREFPVLYASGEEAPAQVRLRAERLGVVEENLFFLADRSLPRILRAAKAIGAKALFLDSIQTTVATLRYSATSPQQLRAAVARVVAHARGGGTWAFLAAQVNKSSKILGPKAVEHLVDVVLILECGKDERRYLRLVKNRYGPTGNVLALRMHHDGLAAAAKDG
ncbi:AAA family ATPase [Candidatus Bipolaricaulota bacterium]|nr:AAA family ATPase [Candidatus Bipolaricaulota bacterium]